MGTWRCWGSVHRPCLSAAQASTWEIHLRSTSCALIPPRHREWLYSCLDTTPRLHGMARAPPNASRRPGTSPKSPAELAQQEVLLVQDQLSRAAFCLPHLPPSSRALPGAGAALVSGHRVRPRLDWCPMRAYKTEAEAQRCTDCLGQRSNQITTVSCSRRCPLCRQLLHSNHGVSQKPHKRDSTVIPISEMRHRCPERFSHLPQVTQLRRGGAQGYPRLPGPGVHAVSIPTAVHLKGQSVEDTVLSTATKTEKGSLSTGDRPKARLEAHVRERPSHKQALGE